MLNLARLIVTLSLLLLGACGQKGPLYLPENVPAAAPGSAGQSADVQQDIATPQDGEPVPDIIPDAMPGPADPENDEDF